MNDQTDFTLKTDGPPLRISVQDGMIYLHDDATGAMSEVDGDHFLAVADQVRAALR